MTVIERARGINQLADELERARAEWHATWIGRGLNREGEREAWRRYQGCIAALGAAIVNRGSERLGGVA